MTTDLWFGIVEYFTDIIIVLALLFALTEASRKYDRRRDKPFLLIATGYFILIIWSLLQALFPTLNINNFLIVAIQLPGLVVLSIGYFSLKTEQAKAAATSPNQEAVTDKASGSVSDWQALLTSDIEESTTTEPESAANLKENNFPATKPSEASTEPEPPILAEEAKEQKSKIKKQALVDQESETKDQESTSQSAEPTKEKSIKSNKPASENAIDLSYLANRKKKDEKAETAKQIPKTKDQKPKNKASTKIKAEVNLKQTEKERILDDLFPLRKVSEDEEPLKPQQVAALLAPLNIPAIINSLGFGLVFIALWRHRHERGNSLLLTSFGLLFLVSLTKSLIGHDNQLAWHLAYHGIEVLGFIGLGLASWQKIKGKVTHHFLTMVSVIYFAVLVLAMIMAQFIVKDSASFQLLLYLLTGIFITLLPIVHSFTYDHPTELEHHETRDE